ncbi:TKL family protein kinase [Trichomonas vaginalis G3]|uniref:TKL family protein kinase n=1 Tax=Trichomonas vaginalis (strain ATCC PRA-98 / G3) TaxID=412133 RepID=A2EL22_TRIV3|nr:protein kinase protein [Trichomonas vaginalis G3]EAY06650.1 TKL family protein kinase [Trichomonas vaginalis G3]KAI5552873.1 protein kinase protein [Trichomonas vaginalis G3]|eukprot:XP_001318873.1 TKL family protein kinase [Trichomonas vaginalis G3]
MKKRLSVEIPEIIRGKIVSLSEFSFIQQICHGSFDLWLAKSNSKEDSYFYAKQVTRQTSKKDTAELFEQLSRIAELKHPFILSFIGVTQSPPFTGFTEAVGRNLQEMLEDPACDSILTGTKTTIIAMCIADAMEFIHKKGYSMPHLNTGSIFITEDLTPRLSLIEDGCMELPNWTPPEIYKGKPRDEKSDVFLFGFLLFELLTGYIPFQELSAEETQRVICVSKKRPQIPSTAPEPLKLLIKHCWSPKKINRPTFAEIYQLFELGTVAFPNSDIEAIRSFIKVTKHLHRKHNHASLHAFDLYNSVTSTRRNTHQSKVSTVTSTMNDNYSSISKNDNPVLPPPPQPAEPSFQPKSRFSSSTSVQSTKNDDQNSEKSDISDVVNEEPAKSTRKSKRSNHSPKPEPEIQETVKSTKSLKNQGRKKEKPPESDEEYEEESMSDEESYEIEEEEQISEEDFYDETKSQNSESESEQEEEEYEETVDEHEYSEEESERNIKEDKISLTVNSFGDYLSAEFNEALVHVEEIVHAGNVLEFMKKMPPLMKKMVPIDIKNSVFAALRKVMKTKEAFDAFKEANVLPSLPTSQREMTDVVIDFLVFVFSYSVEFVTFEFLRQIPPLLRSNPKKSLEFESILTKDLSKLPESDTILDQIVKNYEYFEENECFPDYICLLFVLCQDDDFFDKHGDFCIEYFQKTIKECKNVDAVKKCYETLISFSPDDPNIDLEIVAEQLNHPILDKFALGALIRIPNVTLSRQIVKSLLDISTKYEEASLFLMKKCDKDVVCAKHCFFDHSWLLNDMPTFQHTLRLFIVLFKHKDLKNLIVTFSEVPLFFTNVLNYRDEENSDETIPKSIGQLFNQLPFSRSCLESFESAGFFTALFERLEETMDESAQVIYLRVMGRIAEFGFLQIFNQHISIYKELMKGTTPVAKACFSTMNTLTMHTQCLKAFKMENIDLEAEKYLKGKIDQRPLMTFITRISNASIA